MEKLLTPYQQIEAPYRRIEVEANPNTNFVRLVLSEAQKLYGKDFEFQKFTITNHSDGTYSVEFVIHNRIMV